MTDKLVSSFLYTGDGLFGNKKDKPRINRAYCSLNGECPLLKKGKCIQVEVLGKCVYGHNDSKTGPGRRSNSYYSFVADARKQVALEPKAEGFYEKHLVVIGEWVYLPYAHMTMCEAVPFKEHSKFIISGSSFMKVSDFTPDNISKLVDFLPQALFGGIIEQYQKISIPLFLFHLKHMMNDLYNKVAKINSNVIIKTANIDKITSLPAKLEHIIEGSCSGYVVGDNDKVLFWGNNKIEIEANNKDFAIFSKFKGSDYRVSFIPDTQKTKITITDKNLIKSTLEKYPELLNEEVYKGIIDKI